MALFRAAHNFDLVNVFGGGRLEKIHHAAGRIDGRAVHEDLGKVGIAAVQKNRGGAARKAPCGRQRWPGEKLQKLRKGNGLALADGFTGDYVGGRGGLLRGVLERIAR